MQSEKLFSFTFTVLHRSGNLNANADATSRRSDWQNKNAFKIEHTLFKEEKGRLTH
jgi:hypothetical protein